MGSFGLNRWLASIDDSVRSPFIPYGLSGLMLAASIVFFAYIGFDSISTHSEEARNPHRDVPIGILASLAICTVLYLVVSAVITGMEPYHEIDRHAAVAAAFRHKAEATTGMGGLLLRGSGGVDCHRGAGRHDERAPDHVLEPGADLPGDGPRRPAAAVDLRRRCTRSSRRRTVSTILTGVVICLVAAFTPIAALEEMVSIGTLMAFVIVCAAVLVLRVTRPDVKRPFRCPAIWIVAPLGILRQPDDDALPAAGDVAPPVGLAGCRLADLFWLWVLEQHAASADGRRGGRRRAHVGGSKPSR